MKECKFCKTEVDEKDNYCKSCGAILEDISIEKILDIEMTKEDIADYCFKGYIEKEVKVGNLITVKLRTLTQRDIEESHREVDSRIEENVSDETYELMKTHSDINKMVVELNGKKPPKDIGSDLSAIILQKGLLLKRLVLESLQKGQVADF